jgi:hypothetical protein
MPIDRVTIMAPHSSTWVIDSLGAATGGVMRRL